MSRRPGRADGFHIVSGLLALTTGPILLARGAPAGWSFLLIAAGIAVLAIQWAIASDIRFAATDNRPRLIAATAMGFVTIAVVYLTRAADDLPSLFPGHDGDSEHFRILPGTLILMIGVVLLARAVAAMHPSRAAD